MHARLENRGHRPKPSAMKDSRPAYPWCAMTRSVWFRVNVIAPAAYILRCFLLRGRLGFAAQEDGQCLTLW